MRVKSFILWIGFFTLICLGFLVCIFTSIDPYNTTILSFILFYFNFFVALAGLFILAGFYLRKLFIKKKIAPRLFKASFKQGILISITLTGLLLVWTLIK